MKTLQEIFDKTATHLLRQGQRAIGTIKGQSGRCKYRGRGGLSCAIGCHFEGDNYNAFNDSV